MEASELWFQKFLATLMQPETEDTRNRWQQNKKNLDAVFFPPVEPSRVKEGFFFDGGNEQEEFCNLCKILIYFFISTVPTKLRKLLLHFHPLKPQTVGCLRSIQRESFAQMSWNLVSSEMRSRKSSRSTSSFFFFFFNFSYLINCLAKSLMGCWRTDWLQN